MQGLWIGSLLFQSAPSLFLSLPLVISISPSVCLSIYVMIVLVIFQISLPHPFLAHVSLTLHVVDITPAFHLLSPSLELTHMHIIGLCKSFSLTFLWFLLRFRPDTINMNKQVQIKKKHLIMSPHHLMLIRDILKSTEHNRRTHLKNLQKSMQGLWIGTADQIKSKQLSSACVPSCVHQMAFGIIVENDRASYTSDISLCKSCHSRILWIQNSGLTEASIEVNKDVLLHSGNLWAAI